MVKSGQIERIYKKYTYSPPNVQCEEKKVSTLSEKLYNESLY